MSRTIRMEILKKLLLIFAIVCIIIFIVLAALNTYYTIKDFDKLAQQGADTLLDRYEDYRLSGQEQDNTVAEMYALANIETNVPNSTALLVDGDPFIRSGDYLLLSAFSDDERSDEQKYIIKLDTLNAQELGYISRSLASQVVYRNTMGSGDVYGGIYDVYTTEIYRDATLDGIQVQGEYNGRVVIPWKITSLSGGEEEYIVYESAKAEPADLDTMTFTTGVYLFRLNGEYTEEKNYHSALSAYDSLTEIIDKPDGDTVKLTKFVHKYEKYYEYERLIDGSMCSAVIYMTFSPIGSFIHRMKLFILVILIVSFVICMYLADIIAKKKIKKSGGTAESLKHDNQMFT